MTCSSSEDCMDPAYLRALGARLLIQYSLIVHRNLACQDLQLKSDLRANFLGQLRCSGSMCFVTMKECIDQINQDGWEICRPNVAFCPWNLYNDGQLFFETAWLISSLWFLRLFRVCKRWLDQNLTSLLRPCTLDSPCTCCFNLLWQCLHYETWWNRL